MTAKTFEIRDRMTFIPVLAVKLEPSNEADRYLLGRAGFGIYPENQARYIQLIRISGGEGPTYCNPGDWADRTMQTAHLYLLDHFDELESGSIVDVEHILGETTELKVSERITAPGF
jgi:hypothetical protein